MSRVYTQAARVQKRRYYEAVVAEGDCWLCRVTEAAKPSIYCRGCLKSRAAAKREKR